MLTFGEPPMTYRNKLGVASLLKQITIVIFSKKMVL